jgi:hypothetical protein
MKGNVFAFSGLSENTEIAIVSVCETSPLQHNKALVILEHFVFNGALKAPDVTYDALVFN